MNKSEIVAVLYELHRITGFRVSLHGANLEEIAAYPKEPLCFCKKVGERENELKQCLECDRLACRNAMESRKTYVYKCRYGLTEAVSPIYNFGTLTGFLMMGQILRDTDSVENTEHIFEKSERNTDYENRIIKSIPIVRNDMVDSYVKIMTICAQYLTLSNAIPSVKPTTADLAKKYVDDNIGRKICITDICDKLRCSKSTLLTTFKKRYGITVNTYINNARLEKATHLLTDGDMTISEIASETGFSDQSYFSKVFSAKYGIPPSEYRTDAKHNN